MKKLIDHLRKLTLVARKASIRFAAELVAQVGVHIGLFRRTRIEAECYDANGNLKWREVVYNLVVTAGLNDSLDKHFKGSSYTATWYVGITEGSPTFAAGDTMASHAGWVEEQDYSGTDRKTLTLGTVSGGSVDNSASKASFAITATATVGGAFVTTGQTKGGTTGVLYGGAAFGANRSMDNGDTLNVTVTLTAAAA